MGKITDKDFIDTMSDSNSIFLNAGNTVRQMTIGKFRKHLNDNDELVLQELAFYIDINKASTKGSTRVDTGGSMTMRQLWEDAMVPILMDKNGNYCELNRDDLRYTVEGNAIVNTETNEMLSEWAACDIMILIPQYYGRVQTITVGGTTIQRCWFSLVPLPGGYVIPQQVVGKFKASVVSSELRSLPNKTPSANLTIRGFWDDAQTRSKSHGLANLDFRNHLLFYMMSKYGWRDSQGCMDSGNTTLIWGVGLDGTEGLASGQTVSEHGLTNQSGVKTGHTLSFGMSDGKHGVTLPNNNTAHGVNVAGFENPWGQYWEMVQGLCSVGLNVYHWRGNFVPPTSSAPTAETFANMQHVVLTRPTSTVWGMNIVTSAEGQGVYMIPKQSLSGVSYGDSFSYAETGQLWLFGGASNYGSLCGLASSDSHNAWSSSYSNIAARLAYYGDVNKVSPSRLRELIAA